MTNPAIPFGIPANRWSDTTAAGLNPSGLLLYRSNLLGSDLTVSVGFSYNAILNNVGFTLEVLPNVVAMNRRTGTGLLSRGLVR